MARIGSKALSAKQVETEKRLGFHADAMAMGLYLQVAPRPTGGVTRSWVFRYTSPTLRKRRAIGLGSIAIRKLAEARSIATDYRRLLLDGIDPKEQRDDARHAAALARAKTITFDEAAMQCITAKEAEWRNVKHAQQWRNTLSHYASPTLGKLPVDKITTELVFRALEPIWLTKTETATRVRQRIEQVLDWAKARGFREGENPARLRGGLGELLPNAEKIKQVEHHPAVPYREAHSFLMAVRAQGGIAPLAIELMLLTAARTGEVIAATWDEFDLDSAVWTVPAARMKARREHRVPLCPRAIEILTQLDQKRQNDYVFPAHSSKSKTSHLSNGACLVAMKRLPDFGQYTPHGLRSTFRDWAAEMTNFTNETVEQALAHTIKNKAEAAYRRGDQLEKRAQLMAKWQRYLEQPPQKANVMPLRRSEK